MHTYQFVPLTLCVLIVIGLAEAADPSSQAACRRAVDAQATRFSAMISEDVIALSELLAEDLSYSHTSGWTETKSGFLSTIESKAIDYLGILPSNLSCRLHNKTAIIIGDSAMSLLVQGEPLQLRIRFLDVSYEVDGAWFLIAWQSVRLKDE